MMDALDAKGRKYLVDPVLDPINFGFTQSLERYAQVRRDRPKTVTTTGLAAAAGGALVGAWIKPDQLTQALPRAHALLVRSGRSLRGVHQSRRRWSRSSFLCS